MVSSPLLAPMRIPEIPEVVIPPIAGEAHRYYGNIHLKQLKLPNNNNLRGTTTTSYPRYSEDGSIEGDLDIHDAAAAGNFTRVKELLAPQGSGETSSAFLLANDFSPSSGLTPLHYAASRGHYDIVKWLIDAGAIVDLEDQTGETALLKASYNGHSSVVALLIQKDANVSLRDNDGWTALHNASAQGHLKIVKYFIEYTKADIDVKSSKGYTPLMNAASKGNIETVEYLLDHHSNPFIKNRLNENAYDVAATSQEIYICGLLEKAEREWWKGKRALPNPTSFKELADMPNFDKPYNVNDCHITVPVIIHENQRSATSFGLSLRGSPKYSSNNLLKSDFRGPWSLPDGRPTTKDEVKLPVAAISSSASTISNATASKSRNSWFWVTDWQIDMTHPRVDSQGWQYAKNFEENEKNWYTSPLTNSGSWVRRRRWVRVMKRVVDVSKDGGNVLQFVSENNTQIDGVDYVKRAESIINKKSASEADQLAQYTEAIDILLSGSKNDTNQTRKEEAKSLANTFLAHAEHLDNRIKRIDTGTAPTSPSFKDVPITPTISKSSSPTPFRIESSPVTPASRPNSVAPTITNLHAPSTLSLKSNETTESPWNHTFQSDDAGTFFGESSVVSPTRAHAQLGLTVANVQANNITPFGKWENDEDVQECRRCRKKFGLWIRRHHCRRCGQVVCDRCSTARVSLPSDQVLTDPSQSGEASQPHHHHRVCDTCYQSLRSRPRSNSFTSATIVSSSSTMNHRRRMSNNSTMTECPVCNVPLSGGKSAQEHISNCVDNNSGNGISGYKYSTNSLKITPSLVKNVPFVSKNSFPAKTSQD
ncbi:unnamed protein product [Rhizophagus irregularis]|uniref:FYVE-type domain-containing protein n=1 Tax=Rhizophagus irregularis TaxID=588596 RepID=A0A915YX52_9GLOM|nr:unnamed protein product [Rhizophagus irregularis]CAB4478942.1 unnamed protein product [Rhizophagus irregularis]CAB5343276.1 unnamed protein product [Rhizophagus irregularis]CAB5349758.1 unnamed protein product [Rhizophagus irregularis]